MTTDQEHSRFRATPLRLPFSEIVSGLARVFEARGRQLYLVGGSVRDLLLGRQPRELDFTTDALPAEVKQLLGEVQPGGIYTIGEKFGTIGAIFPLPDGAEPLRVEITTYRAETYQPYSRKPNVAFGQSLIGDLSRRDFTINAIAFDVLHPDGPPVDPHDGQGDLDRGLVRAVGQPGQRFAEDPLRLLRAVRFATQLHFHLDDETAEALTRQAADLAWVPKERIQPELGHVLLSGRAAEGIRQLCDLGLMEYLVPELLALRGMHEEPLPDSGQARFRHKDVFEHTLKVVDNVPADLTLRWAALLHDIAKPQTRSVEKCEVHFHRHELVGKRMARAILRNLKYPRALVDDVALLVELHLRPNSYEPSWTDGAVRRLMLEAGDNFERLLLLSQADVTSRRVERRQAASQRVNALQARCDDLRAQAALARLTSPLDGVELMEMFGRGPGPWIKPIKDRLTELVIEGDLAIDDKQRAADIARALVAQDGERESGGTGERGGAG